ncbi:MAG TPA: hypothetical protein VGF73_07985 [Chthoniobacterales bacterium]|jgi:hypothetical protein
MTNESLLDRIFRLARRVPAKPSNEMPNGLETAVLAHWQEGRERRLTNGGTLQALRWAALAAVAIALLTAALQSDELAAFNRRSDPVTRVADSALVAGYGYE